MVVVKVRDQHCIRTGDHSPVNRWDLPAQMRYAIAQQRVGQQTHTVTLDQERRVAQENDTVRRHACATRHNRAIGHG